MAQQKYPHVNTANRYARDVVAGRVAACEYVVLACQRHLNELKREKQKNFIYRFDREAGEKICYFAELFPHVKGKWAGTKIQLQPWQCFILVVAFGWKRKSDGMRRFREIYAEVERKNGKSVLGAIIALYMTFADGEAGAEGYTGATTEKQAWEVFRPAKLMAERTPDFLEYYGVEVNAKRLVSLKSGSWLEPIIGKPGDGASPHCSIVDEYHEHKTPDLYDTMVTGMGARTQPMQAVITTAGTNLAGPCKAKRNEAVKVLRCEVENDELFAIIYTIDEGDDWQVFDNWIKANPNYGVSVQEDFLRRMHRDAMQTPNRRNIILCKHLNMWMNADVAWMNMVEFKKCGLQGFDIDRYSHLDCYCALDLASKKDLSVLTFSFVDGRDLFSFSRYFVPRRTIALPDNRHYQQWLHEGWLIEAGDAITDYQFIEDELLEFAKTLKIVSVAYDPFQATQFYTRMVDYGLPMIEIGATVKNFSEPMKELEARILSGHFHYDGNPVTEWCFSNVVAHTDKKDNLFPNKDYPENKIDGAVAQIMAMNRIIVGAPDEEEIFNAFREL